MAKMSFTTEASKRKLTRLQELLRQQPCTVQDLADGLFTTVRTANEYLSHLRDNKLVRVERYELRKTTYEHYVPVYIWGKGKDAKRPKPKTPAERMRIHRKRVATDQDLKDLANAKRRAKRRKIKPDWTSCWIKPKAKPVEEELYGTLI